MTLNSEMKLIILKMSRYSIKPDWKRNIKSFMKTIRSNFKMKRQMMLDNFKIRQQSMKNKSMKVMMTKLKTRLRKNLDRNKNPSFNQILKNKSQMVVINSSNPLMKPS